MDSYNIKCNKLYSKFANSIEEDTSIKEIINEKCFNKLVFKNKNISRVKNPLNDNQFCKLITTKKTSKYVHQYDGKILFDKYTEKYNTYSDDFLEKLGNIIDFGKYDNCCNCISIVLYLINDPRKYIFTIYQTVKNIEKYLPNWVLRLYFDTTVHQTMFGEYSYTEEYDCYLKIINSESVEVYTYVCDDFLLTNYDSVNTYTSQLAKIRFFRFLTFVDPSVKTCVIREADGTVSQLDCHNIEMFANSNYGIYLVPFVTGKVYDERNENDISSYSNWLNIYKYYMNNNFFTENSNLYDILAGLVSINFKIKSDFFFDTRKNVLDKILNTKIDEGELPIYMYNYKQVLNIGFDEIFLLELFKDIISCKFTPKLASLKEYSNVQDVIYSKNCTDLILPFILAKHNIKTYTFEIRTISRMTPYNESKQIINDILRKISTTFSNNLTFADLDQTTEDITNFFFDTHYIKQKTNFLQSDPKPNNNIIFAKFYYNIIYDFYVHSASKNSNYVVQYVLQPIYSDEKILSGNLLNYPLDSIDIVNDVATLQEILQKSLNSNIQGGFIYKINKYNQKINNLLRFN